MCLAVIGAAGIHKTAISPIRVAFSLFGCIRHSKLKAPKVMPSPRGKRNMGISLERKKLMGEVKGKLHGNASGNSGCGQAVGR